MTPHTAITDIAARLVQEATAYPDNAQGIRLRELAASLRCAVAAQRHAEEAQAKAA